MKIKIEMELEFVNNLIEWRDKDQTDWLMNEILPVATVAIFSEEIGDYITEFKKIESIELVEESK